MVFLCTALQMQLVTGTLRFTRPAIFRVIPSIEFVVDSIAQEMRSYINRYACGLRFNLKERILSAMVFLCAALQMQLLTGTLRFTRPTGCWGLPHKT